MPAFISAGFLKLPELLICEKSMLDVWVAVTTEQALIQAWRPFAAGWKTTWWECVATPDDVTDEAAFRQGDPPPA